MPPRTVIIGAGPGGLSAAHELSRHGVQSVVLERDSMPGGLARTEQYKGYRFDIGGHRFFTRVPLIEDLWRELLGDDLIERPRLSRIYYQGKFFNYPLEARNALARLGIVEALRCLASYLKVKLFPIRPELTFDAWVSNRFGERLFLKFFKSYTEKVWGIPCHEISADWAAQRIQGLSIASVIKSMFKSNGTGKNGGIKTLIHQFHYPRLGPGMMWERCADLITAAGSQVVYQRPVTRILWEPGKVVAVESGGERYEGQHFISTMPVRDLLRALDPAPPPDVLAAVDDFQYRDFLTVALILRNPSLFQDNWIYIHDPDVKVGRIQNFKNWSPEMVPDDSTTCLGLEYFCFEGDGLWSSDDAKLVELARRELAHLGLARSEDVIDGCVVRMSKAYPVYNDTYERGLRKVREFLAMVPNLQLVGRNGMHRYNNQDHSMLTGILAARNILGARYDLWQVNVDDEYHEAGHEITVEDWNALESSQPAVPSRASTGP